MDNGESSYNCFLNGDDLGLARIVEEYKDGLMLYLNCYVDNIYTAEELTEETFFRLITKRPKFSGKSSFKTWLYAIGRNVAVDYVRKNSRIPTTSISDVEDYICDEHNLEIEYIKDERKIIVHRALEKINYEYRHILWLVFFEHFSNKEAARILKKNERQLRNLLYRAKKSLKSQLEKEGFVYEEL